MGCCEVLMTTLMVVLLVKGALLNPDTMGRTCPSSCECVDAVQEQMYCNRQNLTSTPVPGTSMDNIIFLDVSDNLVTTLPNNTFQLYPNLLIIVLSRNKITSIELDAFNGIADVQIIYLSKNLITYLHPDIFLKNQKLQSLILSGNPLAQLSVNTPIITAPSVCALDLSYCGLISLTSTMLLGLPNLQYLNIQNNNLTYFPLEILNDLKHIQEIPMENNSWTCGDCNVINVFEELKTRWPHDATPQEVTCVVHEVEMVWLLYASRYCNEDKQMIAFQSDTAVIADNSSDEVTNMYVLRTKTSIVGNQELSSILQDEKMYVVRINGVSQDEQTINNQSQSTRKIGEVLGGVWIIITKPPFTTQRVLLICVIVVLVISFIILCTRVLKIRIKHRDRMCGNAGELRNKNLLLAFNHLPTKRDSTVPLLDDTSCPASPLESPLDEPPSLYDEFVKTRPITDHAFSTIDV